MLANAHGAMRFACIIGWKHGKIQGFNAKILHLCLKKQGCSDRMMETPKNRQKIRRTGEL